MDHPGRVLNDRYRLIERGGAGGMAQVWRAEVISGERTGRSVAIKRPRADVDDPADVRSMFLDEARVMAGLRHPNIVEFFDCGHDETGPYLALEWIEGASARTLVDVRSAPLPQEAAVPLVCDVLAGLAESHRGRFAEGKLTRLPIIHRDVSLSNVLVSVSADVKVADFGLARSLAHPRTNPRGTARGKLGYLPPEVVRGQPHAVRGDLYSVGVMLWEALTGSPLFVEIRDTRERLRALVHRPRPSIRSLHPHIAPALAAIVDRALKLEPSERFGNADEMRGALATTIGEHEASRGRAILAIAAAEAVAKRNRPFMLLPVDETLQVRDVPTAPVFDPIAAFKRHGRSAAVA